MEGRGVFPIIYKLDTRRRWGVSFKPHINNPSTAWVGHELASMLCRGKQAIAHARNWTLDCPPWTSRYTGGVILTAIQSHMQFKYYIPQRRETNLYLVMSNRNTKHSVSTSLMPTDSAGLCQFSAQSHIYPTHNTCSNPCRCLAVPTAAHSMVSTKSTCF